MIIDSRCRPPYGTFLDDGLLYDWDVNYNFAKIFNTEPSEAVREKKMDLFMQEMDEAGVDMAVLQVRVTSGGKNEVIGELINQHPTRFIGAAGVNPFDDPEIIFAAIDKFVVNGNFAAVSLEPSFAPTAFSPDAPKVNDKLLYPIYEYCQKIDKPVLLSIGGGVQRSLKDFNPERLDQVAEDFPDLRIICCHGGYPYVNEMCWLANRKKGIYLAPDAYAFYGGGEGYIRSAQYFIPNKVMFGSCFPAVPMKRAIELYDEMLPDQATRERVMGLNALEAFNLK